MNARDQPFQLLRIGIVAREQDHTADARVGEQLAVLRVELETGDIDHQWTE